MIYDLLNGYTMYNIVGAGLLIIDMECGWCMIVFTVAHHAPRATTSHLPPTNT